MELHGQQQTLEDQTINNKAITVRNGTLKFFISFQEELV